MIISEMKTEFELTPTGPQNCVCVDVIDCGEAYGIEADPKSGMRLVPSTNPQYPKAKAKVRLMFESDKLMEDGRPFIIDRTFSATLNDNGHLKPFLDSWGVELEMTPAGPDMVKSLVGKTALINIVHNPDKVDPEKKWANIGSIMPSQTEVKPSGNYDPAGTRDRMKTSYEKRQSSPF